MTLKVQSVVLAIDMKYQHPFANQITLMLLKVFIGWNSWTRPKLLCFPFTFLSTHIEQTTS